MTSSPLKRVLHIKMRIKSSMVLAKGTQNYVLTVLYPRNCMYKIASIHAARKKQHTELYVQKWPNSYSAKEQSEKMP